MTEQEWLVCTEPMPMLKFLRGKASARKLRLFACACCQRIDNLLTDRGKQAVIAAQKFADGLIDSYELHAAWAAVGYPKKHYRRYAASAARAASCSPGYDGTAHAAASAVNTVLYRCRLHEQDVSRSAEMVAQSLLLRDIFGNPFRPAPTIGPAVLAWNDRTVVRLAQAAYEERSLPEGTFDLARLAVLADALEETGVSDTLLLEHLRGPGPHVRGCFAVDAILGRT